MERATETSTKNKSDKKPPAPRVRGQLSTTSLRQTTRRRHPTCDGFGRLDEGFGCWTLRCFGPIIVGTPRPRRKGVQWESHIPRAPNGARGVQRWNASTGRCTWPLRTDSIGTPSCQRFRVTSYAWALCGPFRKHCSYFLALSSQCGSMSP